MNLERLHDESELVYVLGGEFIEIQVFKADDAVDDQSDLVDWQRELLVGFGCNLDWPVVSAEVLNRADV